MDTFQALFGAWAKGVHQCPLIQLKKKPTALEMSEIAIAALTVKLRLPDDTPADKPKRKLIPDHIARVEVELTTGDMACAACGGKLRRLGEDVTEELEYVPRRFIANRIVRPRLSCACCERFIQAPLPSRPIASRTPRAKPPRARPKRAPGSRRGLRNIARA
jgi:hypothetical protein